jgi:hypothetical protein
MSRSTLTTGAIVMLALGSALFQPVAQAQSQPQHSVQALFNRIPKTPATTQDADKMVNANQQIPAITALKADLDVHAAAVEKIYGAADAKVRARMGGNPSPEQAMQGINRAGAVAGIDMARMQNDKAYAQEMQAKMKAMPPQELMAMSMAMQQGMGMRGSVAVYDPPVVKAAAEAGLALIQPEQQATRTATYQRRWADVDKKVAAVNEKFAAKYPKMQLNCDGEGAGRAECVAERARYAAAMTPLLLARDAEVLQVEATALEAERTALAAQVRTADQHLLAAQYGAASQELGNPAHIVFLDQHIVNEIQVLATKFEAVVKRAAFETHCGQKFHSNGGDCYQRQ